MARGASLQFTGPATMFYTVLITGGSQAQLAFASQGAQTTFRTLPIRYLNSPAIAHNLCYQNLNISQYGKCHFWHCIDDIMIGGPIEEAVWTDVPTFRDHLHQRGRAIAPPKI